MNQYLALLIFIFFLFAMSQTQTDSLSLIDDSNDGGFIPGGGSTGGDADPFEPEEEEFIPEPEKTEWTEDESLTIAIHYALDHLNAHPGFETDAEYTCVLSGGEATALRIPYGWQFDFDWVCTFEEGGTISSEPSITVISGVPSGL